MRFLIITLSLVLSIRVCSAQIAHSGQLKKSLDTGMLGKWPSLVQASISNDGNYVSYSTENQTYNQRSLIIKSLHTDWQKEFSDLQYCDFSENSKLAIFTRNDTLYFQQLGSPLSPAIIKIQKYSLSSKSEKRWLIYKPFQTDSGVVIIDLSLGKRSYFPKTTQWRFSPDGHKLLLIVGEGGKTRIVKKLLIVNLSTRDEQTIWTAESSVDQTIEDIAFDKSGKQLSFLTKDRGNEMARNIWYYETGMTMAKQLVTNSEVGIDNDSTIEAPLNFSANGLFLFFSLRKQATPLNKPTTDAVNVHVWRYNDQEIQPLQQISPDKRQDYQSFIQISGNKRIHQIEKNNLRIITPAREVTGNYLIAQEVSYNNQWPYHSNFLYLVSLIDGSRKPLSNSFRFLRFSPEGKFLTYFNGDSGKYNSYDLLRHKTINLGASIGPSLISEYQDGTQSSPVEPVVGWFKNDSALLLYDNYDIWKADPSGEKKSINITAEFGVSHHVKLRIVSDKSIRSEEAIYSEGDTLLLTGLDVRTKYNGFFKVVIGSRNLIEKLTLGPFSYYKADSQKPNRWKFDAEMIPVKARDVNSWVVKRESAKEAPNYFITNDFKTFSPITNYNPQQNYLWLSAELINWKLQDGTWSQGVLYKPENFDPHKKYPVIFNYYEQLSHRLYEFPQPEFTSENVNIPWFVSRGYLVFTPDIHYKIGAQSDKPVGKYALESVESAAKYLTRLPYIDGKHLAIQGHSFGGLETNYIVTHSHLFAAAAEAAGATDPVSEYLTLIPFLNSIEHGEAQLKMENGHELYGATLWEKPQLYLENSAVLHADRVTTPLLIMHNQQDNQIPWRQGIEFYEALRRLGKRAWMLQYDNGTHVLGGKDAIDYTLRLTQFFDYYLKGSPPPYWMTRGIPYRMKGIDDGLALDHSGAKP